MFVPADHGHKYIDAQHQTSASGSIFVTGLDGLHHDRAPTLNDQVIGGGIRALQCLPIQQAKRVWHIPQLREFNGR